MNFLGASSSHLQLDEKWRIRFLHTITVLSSPLCVAHPASCFLSFGQLFMHCTQSHSLSHQTSAPKCHWFLFKLRVRRFHRISRFMVIEIWKRVQRSHQMVPKTTKKFTGDSRKLKVLLSRTTICSVISGIIEDQPTDLADLISCVSRN